MIRYFDLTNEYSTKTYNIKDVYRYVVSHPHHKYEFLINNVLYSNSNFIKYYFKKTKNFQEYLKLNTALNPKTTLLSYAKEKSE